MGLEPSQDLLDALSRYAAHANAGTITTPPHELEKDVEAALTTALQKHDRKLSPSKLIAIFGFLCLFFPGLAPGILDSIESVTAAAMSYFLEHFREELESDEQIAPGEMEAGGGTIDV